MFKKVIKWLYNRFVQQKAKPEIDNVKQPVKDRHKYSDIVGVEIDGEKWWHVTGYFMNRPEDRKLKAGDAIVYRHSGGYTENTVMIVKSFDFPSDTAARDLMGASPYRMMDGTVKITYYSNFAPSFKDYRMATREEIKELLEKYKENNQDTYQQDFREAKAYNNPLYNDLLCQ